MIELEIGLQPYREKSMLIGMFHKFENLIGQIDKYLSIETLITELI